MFFRCKNCGGNVVFEPSRGAMYCPHCEGIDSQDVVEGGGLQQCVNCGAPLNVQDYTSATRCEHCGNYIVFRERIEGVYEPHLLLPFKINKKGAVDAMNKEFGKRIFTPRDFLSSKSLESMEGIYVPFWMYDYDADYRYRGEGTKVRSWTSGSYRYTETSYYQIERKMDVEFDKIPVDASIAMEDGIMDLMEPYNYGELTSFDAKYMSGFYGEVYNEEAAKLEERAQVKARNASEEMMNQSLEGYTTTRDIQKDLHLNRKGVHYALMPVWQYNYKYQGNTYQFHVNGQTGKVIGKTPVAKPKVLAYAASVFALVTAIFAVAVQILEII